MSGVNTDKDDTKALQCTMYYCTRVHRCRPPCDRLFTADAIPSVTTAIPFHYPQEKTLLEFERQSVLLVLDGITVTIG